MKQDLINVMNLEDLHRDLSKLRIISFIYRQYIVKITRTN